MAAQGAGNDYAHFVEASDHLLKAEAHFNKAKALFGEFKAKYPSLAQLQFQPEQLGLQQPLQLPGGGGNTLLQRRMMGRGAPIMPAALYGSPPPFKEGSPNLSGMGASSYPSFEGTVFGNSPEQSRRARSPPPCASPCRLNANFVTQKTPPPYWRPYSFSSCSPTTPPLVRRLDFDTPPSQRFQDIVGGGYFDVTPPSPQRFQDMVGGGYFDTTHSSGAGYSDIYGDSPSSPDTIPRGDCSQEYSYTSNVSDELPSYYAGPTHIIESFNSEDLAFDPVALHALRGGTPPPDSYYETVRQPSPTRRYGYGQPGYGCRSRSAPARPCDSSGESGR